jgi:hypothetical protein
VSSCTAGIANRGPRSTHRDWQGCKGYDTTHDTNSPQMPFAVDCLGVLGPTPVNMYLLHAEKNFSADPGAASL